MTIIKKDFFVFIRVQKAFNKSAKNSDSINSFVQNRNAIESAFTEDLRLEHGV